jgi:hypothetical protein
VTRYSITAVAVVSLTLSVAAMPQHPHPSKPPAEPPPSDTTAPELESLTRAVAIQARPDQVEYFNSAVESTDKALRESRELQQLGAAANNVGLVNAKSLQLRDALDDVEHYNRRLLASFTKTQETELKKLTQRLHKSYSQVSHDARNVADLMEPGKVVPQRLATGAANLEKTLSDFRTDQIRLGREMGIQSK